MKESLNHYPVDVLSLRNEHSLLRRASPAPYGKNLSTQLLDCNVGVHIVIVQLAELAGEKE